MEFQTFNEEIILINNKIKILSALKLASFIEGVCSFLGLILIPSEKNSGFIGNFSPARIALLVCLLFQTFLMLSWYLARKNKTVLAFETKIFSSYYFFYFLLSLLLIIFGVLIFLWNKYDIVLRLLPELVFITLSSFQGIIFFIIYSDRWKNIFSSTVTWFEKGSISLWVTLICCFPLIFFDAIIQKFPLGFSGMYTLMSQEIFTNNFKLPILVPFYGPGGVPFSYPPLGFYLMAIFLKLGGQQWIYLRFAPSILSFLAIIPFFFLIKRLTKSNLAASLTSILVAGSFELFYMQTESGGIVRALAFLLGILSIYFFIKLLDRNCILYALLAGFLFGSCILSHFGYAYYFSFWFVAWLFTHWSKQNLKWSFLFGIISIIVVSPWSFIIISRYGINVFLNAFQSHNTTYFVSMLSHPESIISSVLSNIHILIKYYWLLILVLIGLIASLKIKEYAFPFLFIFNSLFIFEGDRFILIIGFIVASYGIHFLFDKWIQLKIIRDVSIKKVLAVIISLGLIFPIYLQSFHIISTQSALLSQEMIDASNYLDKNSPQDSKYLALIPGDSQADEWIPYLSNRTPLIGGWGSEWTGGSQSQVRLNNQIIDCCAIQKMACVENVISKFEGMPDYLFVDKNMPNLIDEIQISPTSKIVYQNSRYIIFQFFKTE